MLVGYLFGKGVTFFFVSIASEPASLDVPTVQQHGRRRWRLDESCYRVRTSQNKPRAFNSEHDVILISHMVLVITRYQYNQNE
jgi:hypothetical protein